MNVLDLFSGIGGFSLGLERAGMRTVAFCEINDYCRRILKKHWPDVPCYENVRSLTAAGLRADGIIPDAICGGFPCQDISLAGNGEGLEGARSGLWYQFLRLIAEYPEAWVIIENVSALRNRGLDIILGQLAALGRDAEWHCIPASAIGAPHRRDRIWIAAYPACGGRPADRRPSREAGHTDRGGEAMADADSDVHARELVCGGSGSQEISGQGGDQCQRPAPDGQRIRFEPGPSRQDVADAQSIAERTGLCESEPGGIGRGRPGDRRGAEHVSDTDDAGRAQQWRTGPILSQLSAAEFRGGWCAEPDVGRVAYGVSNGVDRLTALGNAVVPQIPELIGRAIMRCESR